MTARPLRSSVNDPSLWSVSSSPCKWLAWRAASLYAKSKSFLATEVRFITLKKKLDISRRQEVCWSSVQQNRTSVVELKCFFFHFGWWPVIIWLSVSNSFDDARLKEKLSEKSIPADVVVCRKNTCWSYHIFSTDTFEDDWIDQTSCWWNS